MSATTALTVGDFNSLPLELLSLILNQAIQNVVVQDRSLTALKFTHVCRSFRVVALDSPQLWTSLHRNMGRPKLAFIETCIERSKDEPLDVCLQFYRPDGGGLDSLIVDGVVQTVLPQSTRWQRCSWQMIQKPRKKDKKEFIPYDIVKELFERMGVPLLVQLSITSQEPFVGFLQHFRTSINWDAPNLSTITLENTATNVIPLPLLSQIRTLETNICNPGIRFEDCFAALRHFVSAAPFLTNFHLSVIDGTFNGSTTSSFTEFPSVKFVRIELLNCQQRQTAMRTQFLWKEFRAFYFPNAQELAVTVGCEDGNFTVLWNGYHIALYSLL